MRFCKHIVDILNILGMQRTTPPSPPQPAPQYRLDKLVLRKMQGAPYIKFSFSQTMTMRTTVQYTLNGITHTDVTEAGEQLPNVIYCDAGTDCIITTEERLYGVIENITFAAVNVSLSQVGMAPVTEIDLRNARLLEVLQDSGTIETIYAKATTEELATISANLIVSSTIENGTVWINRSEPYVQNVIDAATGKGWTIYDL